MATDKKINYINQDGYKNYIKNSDSITIPKKFKARKKATSTHLAYITKAEAAQLKKQNKGTPHKGPKGIPSYDDYDASAGGYGRATSGQTMSGIESGNKGETGAGGRADTRALGYNPQEVADIRGGAQAATAMGQRRGGIGGLLGALGRGALSIFGGIPGRIASGIMTAKNWAQRKGGNVLQGVGEFGDTDEEGNPLYPTWDRYINRNTDKYKDNPYRRKGQAEGGRIGYKWGSSDPEEPAEDIREMMQDQNIPFSEQVEGDPFQMRIQELMGKGLSYDDAYGIAEREFQDLFAEGSEQDQGIASLV